jgi:ribosomal protein S18 acetylase RimI-like enzyme
VTRHDDAVETLALAFADDPLMAWIFEDPAARGSQLRRWWTWIIDHAPGHAELHKTADERSAALWYGPDPVDRDAQSMFPEMLAALIGAEAARHKLAGLSVIPAAHPSERHWYLAAVGTRPAVQGQGSGPRVVRPVLERCDAAGLVAYLESTNPRNVAFYERLGFVVVGPIALPGGPTLTAMRREPARP